jgi:hypothetical protein
LARALATAAWAISWQAGDKSLSNNKNMGINGAESEVKKVHHRPSHCGCLLLPTNKVK